MNLKHFLSQQFAGVTNLPTASPKRLNKGVARYYPELSEMIDLEIKQERLQRLQAENRIGKRFGE
jgi:hypothetical protein